MMPMPPEIPQELKERIMRRVYRTWFLKHAAPLLALELALVVGVAAGVLAQISIRHILLNALDSSAGAWAFVKFFVSNFFVKSIQSRLLVAVYLILAAFSLRDIANALRRLRGLAADELLPFLANGNPPKSLRVF